VVEDQEVKQSCGWQSCMWKIVCDKEDGVCVTKLCVKDGVWKMVCDKVVCERWRGERWCETKWCVKDGVRQSGVW
jgi:hypothetical protein